MSADTQTRLLGHQEGTEVQIETCGRTIRPFFEPVAALVDEAKLRADEDGIHIRAVDPANVSMVEVEAPAEAFESYQIGPDESTVVGLFIDETKSQLANARLGKSTNDPVSLALNNYSTVAEIDREYDGTTVSRQVEFQNIDPDSIRQEPDIPDLNLSWEATVDANAFEDAVDASLGVSDHVRIGERDGALSVSAEGDTSAARVLFEDAAESIRDGDHDYAEGLFSGDYLTDIAGALTSAYVDEITIEWADEFPFKIHFEREEDGQTIYSGTVMQAPRIESGGVDE